MQQGSCRRSGKAATGAAAVQQYLMEWWMRGERLLQEVMGGAPLVVEALRVAVVEGVRVAA